MVMNLVKTTTKNNTEVVKVNVKKKNVKKKMKKKK